MALSDDEQDVPSANLTGGRKPSERVRLEASMNEWALLQEKRQQVMLRLIVASSSAGDRLGLDLVAVLDVSGEKLAKMKTAMHFITSKLSAMDRLCIVGITKRLQFMTKAGRTELRGIVDGGLVATNLSDGLQTGLDVLAGGRLGAGGARTASILLMSDCKQHPSPRVVETGNVVIHTFGFGQDHDLTLLEKIASNSHGGTFNFVMDDEKNLSGPISQVLAGLLSVVVQDLKLTMWKEPGRYREMEATIEKVDGGISYPPVLDADGCITVSFGDLYSGEDRKVIVDILLPDVGWGAESTIIMARCSYSYSAQREAFVGSPKAFHQESSTNALPGPVPPALTAKLLRRRYADMLREASTMGYTGAQGKLVEAWNALVDEKTNRMIGIRNRNALEPQKPNPMIGILEAELEFLNNLNQWGELHACLLAAIMSHCRQRFATRGDVMKVRLFDTPLMRMYLVQAHKFEDNPAKLPPSADQDVEEEEEEKGRPVVSGQRPRSEPRFVGQSGIGEQDRSCRCDWVLLILGTVQAIAAILAGAVVLAVFLLSTSPRCRPWCKIGYSYLACMNCTVITVLISS